MIGGSDDQPPEDRALVALGRHLLVEYRGCDRGRLDDLPFIEALMRRAVEAAGVSIIGSVFHHFAPQGVTGVVVIAESHLSVHTWPELGYAAVDFFTCGDAPPEPAHRVLLDGLGAARFAAVTVQRGLDGAGRGMALMAGPGGSTGEWQEVE